MPAFLGVDHIGIAVKQLDAALNTYGDVLGFPLVGGERLPERGIEATFVDSGGPRIELLAPLHEKSEISTFLHKRGEGLHHICLKVADLPALLAHLQKSGVHVIANSSTGVGGRPVAFIHPKSAHGVLVELVAAASNG